MQKQIKNKPKNSNQQTKQQESQNIIDLYITKWNNSIFHVFPGFKAGLASL